MPGMGDNNQAGGQYRAVPLPQVDLGRAGHLAEEPGSSQDESGNNSETDPGVQANAETPVEGGRPQEDAERPAEAEARMQEEGERHVEAEARMQENMEPEERDGAQEEEVEPHEEAEVGMEGNVEPPDQGGRAQEDVVERPVEAEARIQEILEASAESDSSHEDVAERHEEAEAGMEENMEQRMDWHAREVELQRSWIDIDDVLDMDVDPPEPVDFPLNFVRHAEVSSEGEVPESPRENEVAREMDNEMRPQVNVVPIPEMGDDPEEEWHTPPDHRGQFFADPDTDEDERVESPATRRRRVSSDFENALVSDVEFEIPLPDDDEPQLPPPVQADVERPQAAPQVEAEAQPQRRRRRSRTAAGQVAQNGQPMGDVGIEDQHRRGRRGAKRPTVVPAAPPPIPQLGAMAVFPIPPMAQQVPENPEVPLPRWRMRERRPPVLNNADRQAEDEADDDEDVVMLRRSLAELREESLNILLKMYECAQRRGDRIGFFLEKIFHKITIHSPNYGAFVQMLIDKLKDTSEDRDLFWKAPMPPVMKETVPVRVLYRLVALHERHFDLTVPAPNEKRFLVATFITVDGNLPIGALCVDGRDVPPLRYGGNSNFYVIKPDPHKTKIRVTMPLIATPDRTWFVLQHLEMKPDLVIHRECRARMARPDDGEVYAKTPNCLPDCSFPLIDAIIALKANGSAECPRCGANVILSELTLCVRERVRVSMDGDAESEEKREEMEREVREWQKARLRMRQALARRVDLPYKPSTYNDASGTYDGCSSAPTGGLPICW